MELEGGSYDLGPVRDSERERLTELGMRLTRLQFSAGPLIGEVAYYSHEVVPPAMDVQMRNEQCVVTFRDALPVTGPWADLGDVHIEP